MEYVSGSSYDLTGYHPEEIVNNKRLSYASMIHPQDQLGVWEEVQNAVRENRRFELVYRIITESGSEKTVWECGKGIFSNSNEWLGLEGFIIDFTRQRANAQNLLQHVLYDDLTELPSLPLFLDRLENAMRRSAGQDHKAALIVIHLDRVLNALEQVDSETSNKVSFEICKRLLTLTGPLDSITRLNNERWGILVENQDAGLSLPDLAQDIQDLFLQPITIGKSDTYFTTSIGVALCNDSNQNAEDCLRNASHAMHRAHALGGSRFEIFDAQIHGKYVASV
jgi:GGDEF domain-containing protein